MQVEALIAGMARFAVTLPVVVGDLDDAVARWKPPDGAWSILEIVRHLGDEEVEDFRRRVELTLTDPAQAWPSIDPPGWAMERAYNRGSLVTAVETFVERRNASVAWLRQLTSADWGRTHRHPSIGPLRAGDLLVAWAAHDALHLRQIAKRLYQQVAEQGGDYRSDYAGPCGA